MHVSHDYRWPPASDGNHANDDAFKFESRSKIKHLPSSMCERSLRVIHEGAMACPAIENCRLVSERKGFYGISSILSSHFACSAIFTGIAWRGGETPLFAKAKVPMFQTEDISK